MAKSHTSKSPAPIEDVKSVLEDVTAHVIKPCAIYDMPKARKALGLAKATINREIRLKRLRVSKRAGRYYFLGEWLLQWLREGELKCQTPEASTNVNG
jgi:hypothetical protein